MGGMMGMGGMGKGMWGGNGCGGGCGGMGGMGGGGKKGGNNATMKPGDWTCPSCGDLQFARNASCRQCGKEKPEGAGGPPAKRARTDAPSTGDPQKDALIARINSFQYAGQSEKEAWANYC